MLPFALAFEPFPPGTDAAEAGRSLMRRLAAERLGVAPEDVRVVQRCPDCGGPHGRPVIAGSELRVSLARCARGAVAVAAWGADIGVDIEEAAQPPERLAAIREVAGEGEGESDEVVRWTRVEAVLKADGRGLRVDPRRVLIVGDIAAIQGEPVRYRLVEPDVDALLRVSVALRMPEG